MQEVKTNIAEEKKLIQGAYRTLLRSIKSKMDATDRKNIRMAYELAVKAHSKQRRKSGEPYILHPIEVARICAEEIGLGPTAVVSALLHDVVEDTDVTLLEIDQKFGKKIAMMVNGLTKLDGLYNVTSPQAENFKKVLRTLVEDVRVVLIKMADRLHNMRTLGAMPRHKQLKIAAETTYIYAPLAHRLGLYNIKTEFQDLCMKITDPATYQSIALKLQETKRERTAYVNEFIKPLTQALTEISFPYRITGRPKSIYSIWNKIKTKQVPFEEIYDLFAVRIIVECPPSKEKQVCWQIYSIVTDVHLPIPERLKDWITTPKSNGYESLHTTVIGPKGRYVEVQIRSERMDDIAERGFAAHWKYKKVSDASPKPNKANVYESWLDNVRDILENNDSDAIEFLNDFKTNLFNEEVYVYTPKGDMKILPKGATALDFAFSIHSDVGYHCTAIKVNNKLVPMGYKLQNGDQVFVTTNKGQKPSESWLKMVVTGKARAKIRSSMKEERRKQGEFGKEALQRKLRNMKANYDENIEMLVRYFGFKSHVDLHYAIAMEEINLQELRNFKTEGPKLVLAASEPATDVQEAQNPTPARPRKKTDLKPQLVINGQHKDQYDYTFANCCKPVPGDDVFAYVSATAGMKIHRTTCPNATNLMANFGYRIMKAEWRNTGRSSFVAVLKIIGVDSGPGVIEKLSHNISSDLGLNIRSFYIDGNEGYFEGRISLVVQNKDQLNLAIRGLQNLDGISSVTRIDN
ncbi:MAG: RelA/SpoT family protein [Bacteroidota bacterium]